MSPVSYINHQQSIESHIVSKIWLSGLLVIYYYYPLNLQ